MAILTILIPPIQEHTWQFELGYFTVRITDWTRGLAWRADTRCTLWGWAGVPLPGWDPVGRVQLWLTGWQRSHCGVCRIGGNLPSGTCWKTPLWVWWIPEVCYEDLHGAHLFSKCAGATGYSCAKNHKQNPKTPKQNTALIYTLHDIQKLAQTDHWPECKT